MPARYFTLEEASSALRLIRPWMQEIQSIRRSILARQPDLWPALERAAGNGGSTELSKLATEFDRLDRLVHAITDLGAEIKDLNTGLLDFRAKRRGQAVYLCWKYGEEDILFWHELNSGFSGRRAIDTF